VSADDLNGVFGLGAGHEAHIEPLLAWYSSKTAKSLVRQFEAQQYSLQHFLQKSHAVKHLPIEPECLRSIDTPEASAQIQSQLEKNTLTYG